MHFLPLQNVNELQLLEMRQEVERAKSEVETRRRYQHGRISGGRVLETFSLDGAMLHYGSPHCHSDQHSRAALQLHGEDIVLEDAPSFERDKGGYPLPSSRAAEGGNPLPKELQPYCS